MFDVERKLILQKWSAKSFYCKNLIFCVVSFWIVSFRGQSSKAGFLVEKTQLWVAPRLQVAYLHFLNKSWPSRVSENTSPSASELRVRIVKPTWPSGSTFWYEGAFCEIFDSISKGRTDGQLKTDGKQFSNLIMVWRNNAKKN